MPEMFLVPLKVYGIGFILSMGMALLIKILLDVIQSFSKKSKSSEE